MPFTERWYHDEQAALLARIAGFIKGRQLDGAFIEIGSWEGKSTIAIANACHPRTLHAVDHWLGNLDESADHVSVMAARQRDVFATFQANMAAHTRGNVVPHRQDWREFMKTWQEPIAFCHIDASHDYVSVRDNLAAILPLMVRGGVVCGDDWLSANINRHDLQGGVQRAVMELLPGAQSQGNLWFAEKT